MESILSDLAKSGALKSEQAAASLGASALALLSGSKVSISDADSGPVSLLVSLFVEAARQRATPDDFASTCSDYLPDAAAQSLKAQWSAGAAAKLSRLHSSFFIDLPHVVGVSSTVQHHVRDFAVKPDLSIGEERPRSVANFVFALDLAARGVAAASGDEAADGDVSQVVFQCTAEQAAELAATLRAAAGAMQRTEARLQQQ
jgi:hypothetical protein